MPIGYVAHMIRIITMALNSGTESTIGTVLQQTKRIFALDYRGLLVLVPLYLQRIREVLEHKEGKDLYAVKTKSAAMSILGSLICVPDHYGKYEIPVMGKAESVPMDAVKRHVYDSIFLALELYPAGTSSEHKYLKFVSKAVCCVTVVIYQEAAKDSCNTEIIKVYR